jgi:hypothetical protein
MVDGKYYVLKIGTSDMHIVRYGVIVAVTMNITVFFQQSSGLP